MELELESILLPGIEERTPYQYSQHSGCERVLHRIQLHEQEPQHAGLAYRYARL